MRVFDLKFQNNETLEINSRITGHTVLVTKDLQSEVHRAAASLSPGNLLEMQNFRLHPKSTESESRLLT